MDDWNSCMPSGCSSKEVHFFGNYSAMLSIAREKPHPLAPSPLGRKIFRPNGEGESKDRVWAGGFAARHHPVIPLLSPRRGERRGQGDERGLLKSTAAKFMAQTDLPQTEMRP